MGTCISDCLSKKVKEEIIIDGKDVTKSTQKNTDIKGKNNNINNKELNKKNVTF